MVFSSVVFLFYFLPIFLAAFYLTGFSKNCLLVFSLIFYTWGEPVFFPLMLGMIALNYYFGIAIEGAEDEARRKRLLTISIVANLAPLVAFKYGGFLIQMSLGALGPMLSKLLGVAPRNFAVNQIPLPLGISFYTFHALSYLIDVYRRDVRAERSMRDLAVYISMFPQLVAGPIIRYKTIAGELHEPKVSLERTALGVRIFLIGLSQKVLIANTVAENADAIFGLPADQLSTPLAWLGILCYTVQIYFDFGGYSNMAIGLAYLIGFSFPLNFNYPYIARTMTDFWRRWHISLSSWFRDYLYVPLGGNRVSAVRTYLNLWIVFILCGLWHGAAWNFVAWGAAHGALLVAERRSFGKLLDRAPAALAHAYVLFAVAMTWVLFRADSFGAARDYYLALFGFGAEASVGPPLSRFLRFDIFLALAAAVVGAGPWGMKLLQSIGNATAIGQVRVVEGAGIAALMVLITLSLAGGAYNPFIYFRF